MAGILSIKIRADATPFERSLKKVGRNITSFAQKSLAVGRGISLGFTAPLMAIGASAVNAAADFDSLERALAGIMGGANAAAGEMTKLKEAAKLPGLGFEEAVRGSVNLQAVGLSADEARKTLIGFGTAIAASGGGSLNLASVTKQLTQMISKNRILQEDFGILQENVPLIGDALDKAFGTRNIEKVRDTGIAAADFNSKLVASLITLPAVIAATGGLRNNIDNFKDSLKFAQVELGKAILKNINLEKVIESVTGTIENYLTIWGDLSDETQKLILNTAKYIAIGGGLAWILGQIMSAVGVLTTGLGKLVELIINYNKVTGVIKLTTGGWITIAVAAAVAIGAFAYSVHQANKPIDDLSGYLSSSARAMQKEMTQLEFNLKLINDTNTSQGTRLKLINDIKNKYGQYLPDLKTEQDYLNNMSTVMTVLNTELAKKFEIMKLQGVAEKQLQRSVELAEEEEKLTREIAKQREVAEQKWFGFSDVFTTNAADYQLNKLNKQLDKTRKESVIIEEAWKNTTKQLDEIVGKIPKITETETENNNGNTEKQKTRYELLTDSLDELNKQYEDQVLLYGKNSEGAKVLENNIREVRFEILKVKKALEDLEKLDGFEAFIPLKSPTETKRENKKISEEAKKTVTTETVPLIEDTIVGQSIDDYLNQLRVDEGKIAGMKILSQFENPEPAKNIIRLTNAFEDLGIAIADVGLALEQNLGSALGQSFEALGSALASGENAVMSFAKVFVSSMLDAVNAALQLLLVEMVSKSIMKGGGPIGTMIAIGLGIAAVSFLKSKMESVKLAQGGLAFGPTMAVVGDNRGASYDPEVIAPLSKLKGMLGDIGGGEPYVLTTKVAGSDLLVIMEKARNINTRIR